MSVFNGLQNHPGKPPPSLPQRHLSPSFHQALQLLCEQYSPYLLLEVGLRTVPDLQPDLKGATSGFLWLSWQQRLSRGELTRIFLDQSKVTDLVPELHQQVGP